MLLKDTNTELTKRAVQPVNRRFVCVVVALGVEQSCSVTFVLHRKMVFATIVGKLVASLRPEPD